MPPKHKQNTWLNLDAELLIDGRKPKRVTGDKKRDKRAQKKRVYRAKKDGMAGYLTQLQCECLLLQGMKDLLVPNDTMPLQIYDKVLSFPEMYGIMIQPDKRLPPIFILNEYAMNDISGVVSAISWAGRKFGGVQLRIPPSHIEEHGTWWKTNKNGTVSRAKGQSFHTKLQVLEPLIHGSSTAYCLPAETNITVTSGPQAEFATWAAKLSPANRDNVFKFKSSMDFWDRLATNEEYRLTKHPYGLDAPGNCNSLINGIILTPVQAEKFMRDTSPLNVFARSFNILNETPEEDKIPGIHTTYLYAGTPGTVFCWHLEDYHLYSANYQLDGAKKVWYTVPPRYMINFVHDQAGKFLYSHNVCTLQRCLFN